MKVGSGGAELADEPPFLLGALRVEPALRSIIAPDGERRPLEPKVMQVLLALSRAHGKILSRAVLRTLCWEGRVVSDDAIDRVIARIRRVGEELRPHAFTLETIPKGGYRLLVSETAGENATTGTTDTPAHVRVPHRRAIAAGFGLFAAAAAGGLLIARRSSPGGGAPASDLALAVLPFEAASQTLADAAAQLCAFVRTDLVRVDGLRVAAERSTVNAARSGGSARKIAGALDVHLLIQGSVRQTTEGVEVTAALIDAAQDRQVWTVTTRSPQTNINALRHDLSGRILQHIVGLVPASGAHSKTAISRPDPEAYALVAQAYRLMEDIRTDQMRGRAELAFDKAEQAFALAQHALRIDADYADGLIVLANLTRNGWTRAFAAQPLTTRQRVEQSLTLVRQALVSDPNNPRALTLLGDYYRRFAFRWTEAEALFRRALETDPGLIDAHWSYAYMLGTTGQSLAGLSHAVSAFELAPGAPFRRLALPRLLYLAGDRPSALARYGVELGEQPDNLFLLRELYLMFLSEGSRPDLVGLRDRVADLAPHPSIAPVISQLGDRVAAACEALAGRPGRLREMVDKEADAFGLQSANATPQGRARDDLPYIFAIEYAWSGATDEALRMLDRALVGKSLYWPATLPFGSAPFPHSVRSDPRFPSLWNRDPGLAELMGRRRAAVEAGQMRGYRADGKPAFPSIDAALKQRVANALRRDEASDTSSAAPDQEIIGKKSVRSNQELMSPIGGAEVRNAAAAVGRICTAA